MNTHTHTHRHRRISSRGSDGYERLRSPYANGGRNITDRANWNSVNFFLTHFRRLVKRPEKGPGGPADREERR